MKTGFSIVELIIIVAILWIPPAIAAPQFRSQSGQSREAAVKDNLQILRQRIYLYAARHNGFPPGYPDGVTSATTSSAVIFSKIFKASNTFGQLADAGKTVYPMWPYLSETSENPFNQSKTVKMKGNTENFPADSICIFGWISNPLPSRSYSTGRELLMTVFLTINTKNKKAN